MDSSLPSVAHNSDTRYQHTQLQPFLPNNAHPRTPHEKAPPSKRRRANSAHPSEVSTTESTAVPTSTDWQSQNTHPLSPANYPFGPGIPRHLSPDQSSRVSKASSLSINGPQLRKKPKSSSIKNTNTLHIASAAIAKSPSLPAFHLLEQNFSDIPQDLESGHRNSVPGISRANSGTSQHQSPTQKRPPASHSSYGVGTTCGPPPSYSTQRTLSQERIRKVDRNSQTWTQTISSDQAHTVGPNESNHTYSKEGVPSLIQSSPDTTDTQSIPTPTDMENMAGVNIHGEQRTSTDEEAKASSSDERKSEDLFLNIARTDAARPLPPKTEKRRSRISIPFLPIHRSSTATRSSPAQSQFDANATLSQRSEAPQHRRQRISLGNPFPTTYPTKGPLLDNGRFREQSADLVSDHGRSEHHNYSTGLRRSSTTNTESARLGHRSSIGLRSSRLVSESVQMDQLKNGEHMATESTISTTAPSTVWDELDDLKSRIRNLELTGKLPASSAAAMGVSERPRTATTAATTMSTSPKYRVSEPSLPSPMEGVSTNVHPLLHEALNNAGAVLSHEIYQKLYATAQDALQIAAMTGQEGNGRSFAITQSNERQIRRRTESLCRGLTELAIVLTAEAKPTQPIAKPGNRDQSLPPNSMLRGRRYSNDPSDRNQVSSRVQSRLDNRRLSAHLGRNSLGHTSPEHELYQSPATTSQPAEFRSVHSSSLLRKRGQGSFDGANDQYDASPSIRPGSRAMTDLGAYRRTNRGDHIHSPREYTSQHPLPTQQERETSAVAADTYGPVNMNTNFTSRRKYASPTSVVNASDNVPMTPREAWGRIATYPMDSQSPDVASDTGGLGRGVSARRSLGFAGRVGTSVESRLRAVRAERKSHENTNGPRNQGVTPSEQGRHATSTINADMY